jgi:3-hydroxyisobutyrate dehydrogenase-like beta-hydroxyacid dehydrogenase
MGAAVGAVLRGRGHDVRWASAGRSDATASRAEAAGLVDVGSVDELAGSDVILSVCPPHAAVQVSLGVAGFGGIYVDANAVSPATARSIASAFARPVDGGIVGGPPRISGKTRLYLSGPEAATVAELFADTALEPRVLSKDIGQASALKMVYAAWSKGTAAMLLAIRAVAQAHGVDDALVDEWRESIPELPERSAQAARSAGAKGWRWVAEMQEIAATFAAADLPDGFHEAAAEVFRRTARADGATVDDIVHALTVRSSQVEPTAP